MQNLEPILIFITVAEMGSFTHAADSLGIQKGRASTAVRKLEEDVGVRLLHRTTRSVQLTEDGRVFHARARDLLAEVDDLHSMFAGDRWHFAGVYGSIFRPRWRAQRSCRPCRISWRLIPSWSWRCRVRIGKSIWFKRGSTVYCGLDP
jgi:DNA-binding transcriptional LysR family regulator